MFGLSIEKLILLGVIASVVIGPERLPEYARVLKRGIQRLSAWVDAGKTRLESEVGEEIDWRQLNPRQYDPRRIIRSALAPAADEAIPSPQPAVRAGVKRTPTVPAGDTDD